LFSENQIVLGIEDVLDSEVEAAVATEQRADAERTAVVVGIVHEGSGQWVNPDRTPLMESLPGWSPSRCTSTPSCHASIIGTRCLAHLRAPRA
jgi:hypothetical protein